jgi:tetratricopeptide (TPR) repeat protein
MAQIIKFPVSPAKFGYTRVKKRARGADDPNQLNLFPQQGAKILNLTPSLSLFEQALSLDEREDARAAELYQQAIAHGDCVADAHCNLGIIQSKRGLTAKAFDSFTKALEHNPRHFEAHYNLGNMYFEVNDYRLAQIHYEIAAEINPSFANAYFNLALVRTLNNELCAAANALTTYQSLVPLAESRSADELLKTLRKSAAVAKNSDSGSAG